MDFFRFLQVRHFLQTHADWELIHKPPSNLERIFMLTMEGTIKNNLISHFYRRLQDNVVGNTWDTKQKWELEMNICITGKMWENSLLNGHKLTSSPTWREFEWKTKIRFFKTPRMLARYSNTSDLCWRECGKIGDHTHIYWDCPKVDQYWRDIQFEIKLIMGVDLPLEPDIFILGKTPGNTTSKNQAYLIWVLLLIAKKMITVLWRNVKTPTFQQWRVRVKNVYLMESITAKLQLKTDAFIAKWEPVILQLQRLIEDTNSP